MHSEIFMTSPLWFQTHPDAWDIEIYAAPIVEPNHHDKGKHIGEPLQFVSLHNRPNFMSYTKTFSVREITENVSSLVPVLIYARDLRGGDSWNTPGLEALCRGLRIRNGNSNPIYFESESDQAIPAWASILLSHIEITLNGPSGDSPVWDSIQHWHKTDVRVRCESQEDVREMAVLASARYIPPANIMVSPQFDDENILGLAARYGFMSYPQAMAV